MFNFKQIPGYFSWFFKPFKKTFTKPQYDNFKRLISGHVLSDKKTIQEINAVYGDKDQSSLNRFVTQSDWDLEEVDKARLKLAVEQLGSKKEGFIVLDDTMAIKTGKKMEKANYHRSGVTKKKEWGHCFVDSVYTDLDSDIVYPIKISSYLRGIDTDATFPFKTKRELALEQIDFARDNGVQANTVLSDAWYYSEEFIKSLKSRNMKYFIGVKSNKKMSVTREKRIDVKEYLKTLEQKDFHTFKLKKGTYFLHIREISIRGLNKQTLLVSYKEEDENNIKCYITNHFKWFPLNYMKALLKRWSIETFHKDTKQHLGLEKYQVRKYRGMQVVALAILTAYTLLILNAAPSLLKKFRPLQTIGEMCRFAQLVAQKSCDWLKKKLRDSKEGARILNQLVLVKNAKV